MAGRNPNGVSGADRLLRRAEVFAVTDLPFRKDGGLNVIVSDIASLRFAWRVVRRLL